MNLTGVKILKLLGQHSIVAALFLTNVSCSSIKVFSSFDELAYFAKIKSYAFYTKEINDTELSELDKRIIMRNIDSKLSSKGIDTSDTPEMLVGFTTKTKERVYVFNNSFNWGFYPWTISPWLNNGINQTSTRTIGLLYINIYDSDLRLIWQGTGRGFIKEHMKNRNDRIALFVSKIMDEFPPSLK